MTDKKKLLKNFFNKYKNLPEQGSDEWLNIKKYTIGGSEIACVINKNSFLSPKNLIYNKLTDYKVDNIAVKWGNIYEPITNKTMELIFNINIRTTGSIPGVIDGQRFSPDGLGVLDNNIILFEYKCPYTKEPTKSIPEYYIPQLLTGLCSIDIVDKCYFVNTMYRICNLDNFKNNLLFNNKIHNKSKTKNSLYSLGFLFFYINSDKLLEFNNIKHDWIRETIYESSEEDNMDKNKINQPIVDIGKFDKKQLDILFQLLDNNIIKIKYSPIILINKNFNKLDLIKSQYTDEIINIDNYILKKKYKYINKFIKKYGDNVFGIMPYKLLNIHILEKQREPNFIKQNEKHIKKFLYNLNSLKNIKKKNILYNKLEKLYKNDNKYYVNNSNYDNIKYNNRLNSLLLF
tara:strand:- start:3275 stop:4480 length:1206 start_codon:yes stop_codon:yes gene_type:complete